MMQYNVVRGFFNDVEFEKMEIAVGGVSPEGKGYSKQAQLSAARPKVPACPRGAVRSGRFTLELQDRRRIN
ncbi:hypothetical protein WAI453_010228 [Rhynchosporium graminicola]